jgi:hypothetical protein
MALSPFTPRDEGNAVQLDRTEVERDASGGEVAATVASRPASL